MPTNKPRVQVTLEPYTHDVIKRLADLQGRTRGSVISELLDSVAPSLTKTVALLEAAFAAPESIKQGMRSVVEGVHQELTEVAGDATKQLDFLLDRISDGNAETGANPHVVTRGSGINPPTPKPASKKPRKASKSGDSANG